MFSRSFENVIDKTKNTKSCDITTDIEYHNSSIDFLNDHKYYKVITNIDLKTFYFQVFYFE